MDHPVSSTEMMRQELLNLPRGRQLLTIRNRRRFQTAELCDRLLEHAWEVRFQSPRDMLREARLAVSMADCALGPYHQALGRVTLANALRIRGHMDAALALLRDAEAIDNTGSPVLRAKRFGVLGAVLVALANPAEACLALEESLRVYQEAEDIPMIAVTLVQLSVAVSELDPVQALRISGRAARIIDPNDGRLILINAHNGAEFHLLCGLPERAQRIYSGISPLYESIPDLSFHAKRWHLAAHIAEALGLGAIAEKRFKDALNAYRANEQWYFSVVVGLELANLLSRSRRATEAEALVREASILFPRLHRHERRRAAPFRTDLASGETDTTILSSTIRALRSGRAA